MIVADLEMNMRHSAGVLLSSKTWGPLCLMSPSLPHVRTRTNARAADSDMYARTHTHTSLVSTAEDLRRLRRRCMNRIPNPGLGFLPELEVLEQLGRFHGCVH